MAVLSAPRHRQSNVRYDREPKSTAPPGSHIDDASALLPEVSLIIPAHNEEHRLAAAISPYLLAFGDHFGQSFEVLIVANGCTDGTVAVAHRLAETWPQVRVLTIGDPIGKGGAVLEGLRAARGERMIFADADGATAPHSLVALVGALDDADVVIGSRRHPSSAITRGQPRSRRLASRLFSLAVRSLFAMPYHDTQCGAKALRRQAAHDLAGSVQEHRWAFDVDLLRRARAARMCIAECPVTWHHQPGSHLSLTRASTEVVGSLWRMARTPAALTTDGVAGRRILALNWRCLKHPQAGGAELNLFEQAERWAQDGHDVTVFCARRGRGDRAAALAPSEHMRGVNVVRRGGWLSVYLHGALFLLAEAHNYDAVLDVANGIPFFAPLFTSRPVTLLVHHVHDRQWAAEFPAPIARVGRFLEMHVVPHVYRRSRVIAVSPTTRDALLATGMRGSQVQVVYNGMESQPTPRDLAPDQNRICYVGRLKRYKRLHLLIQAVADLRTEFPQLRLDIAGDGDARAELEALATSLGVADAVTFHGFVDEQTKCRLLATSSVFATPSMQEGWGLSVLEANSAGCPAVAFDVPGLNVAIHHQTTGLLARTEAEFTESIAMCLRDEALRQRLSDGAHAWAATFDWTTTAKCTLEILLKERGRGAGIAPAYGLVGEPGQ